MHELVDRLSDDDAAKALVYVEWLVTEGAPLPLAADGGPLRPHQLPALHSAPVVTDPAELQGDVFPPEESADDVIATIRRWRDEGQPE